MDRLKLALEQAARALSRLEEVLAMSSPTGTDIVRDAAVQRFEFTFEALWKAARHFLLQREGVDAASPKGVIRACHRVGLLTHDETAQALAMTDDRNLTSHTYDESLAALLYQRLPDHARLMRQWLERMRSKA